MLLDCRMVMITASGATPRNAFRSAELPAAPMIPATMVPWPSQSSVPSPVNT